MHLHLHLLRYRFYRVKFFATEDWAFVSEKNIEFYSRDYEKRSLKSVSQNLSLTRQRLFQLAMQEIVFKFEERFGTHVGGPVPLKYQQSHGVKVINPCFKP